MGLMVSYVAASPDGEAVDRAVAALALSVLIPLVNLAMAAIHLGGSVALSLRKLGRRAEQIGNGDFAVEIQPQRADKIGDLHRLIGAMRDSLEETVTDLEDTKAAMEAE